MNAHINHLTMLATIQKFKFYSNVNSKHDYLSSRHVHNYIKCKSGITEYKIVLLMEI